MVALSRSSRKKDNELFVDVYVYTSIDVSLLVS